MRRPSGLTVFAAVMMLGASMPAGWAAVVSPPPPSASNPSGTGGLPGTPAYQGSSPRAALADSTGALTTLYSADVQGGYVAAGVGMRNLGYGHVSVTGIPAGSTVTAAFLLWDVLDSSQQSSDSQGVLNGSSVSGTSVGVGASPCWPASNNYAFEADVKTLVTRNGSYSLTGFASGATDGSDPWNVGSPVPMMEGASLVVIYQNGASPLTHVEIGDGSTMTSGATLSATFTGFTVPSSPSVRTTFIVADGQSAPDGPATFNNVALNPGDFQGLDPQDVPSYSQGNLWDTSTYDVSSAAKAGDTSETATIVGTDDCLVWVGQALAVASGGSTPLIKSVDPPWAPFTGGTTVTINGSNFGTSPSVLFTDNCGVGFSFFFSKYATIISSSPTQIVVSVPSAESSTAPGGLDNVAFMNGPACLQVSASGGSVNTSFTYVVPEIGLLFNHNPNPGHDEHPFNQCTAEAVQSGNHRVVQTAGHCLQGANGPLNDIVFAPGYFGPTCPGDALKGSSSLLNGPWQPKGACPNGGTAPYGIWCVDSSMAKDPGCGTTPGKPKISGNFGKHPNTEDFGYIVTTPKNGQTLGQAIGGGLKITFNWTSHIYYPGNADQSWNIFGYHNNYLDTCFAPTTYDDAYPDGNDFAAVLVTANGGDPACSFMLSGASGGPWINGQNGAFYGVGAVNDTAPCDQPPPAPCVNSQGLVTGAYMGRDARALFNTVQNLP
jgi:hypothetical protein